MKTKIIFCTLLLIAIISAIITGCKKDDSKTTQKESNADRNSTFAQQTFDQEEGNIDFSKLETSGKKSVSASSALESACLTTTLDWQSSPMKLTLNFGTTNCLCADGKYRRGKMFVTFNGRLRDSLTTVTMTFENYFVNDNQIIGVRSITNKGHNNSGHLNFDIYTNGSIVLANNGGTITYLSTHNREWTQGENTLVVGDDVYTFRGSASGTTTAGQAYTIAITTPLVWKMSCTHFVSGVFELTPVGEPKRVIDYGFGECDNLATVSVLGYSFQITLP
jgi:hypothetical protein